jgi:sarcosine oxidase subunit beta
MPSLSNLKVLRQWTGILDTTPDHKPLIGETGVDGLIVACGFHEYGITLAPIVSKMLTNLVVDGIVNPLLQPFSPQRFSIME